MYLSFRFESFAPKYTLVRRKDKISGEKSSFKNGYLSKYQLKAYLKKYFFEALSLIHSYINLELRGFRDVLLP